MEAFYIWINASGFGPSHSLLITTINDSDYKIDKHLFDNWTFNDVFEVGLNHITLAPNCYKRCKKFTISCQNIRTGNVIVSKTFNI